MTENLFKVVSFVNEKIRKKSKQETVQLAGVITILWAKTCHEIKYSLGWPLKLQIPNDTLRFPLPNRWSSPDS